VKGNGANYAGRGGNNEPGADVAPLRDGTKGAALRKITPVDTGQSFSYSIRDQERPNLDQDAYKK